MSVLPATATICEVMVEQSRAIENRRLVRALKPLPRSIVAEVVEKLRTLGELSRLVIRGSAGAIFDPQRPALRYPRRC